MLMNIYFAFVLQYEALKHLEIIKKVNKNSVNTEYPVNEKHTTMFPFSFPTKPVIKVSKKYVCP